MFDYDHDGSLKIEAGFIDQVIIRSKLTDRDNLTTNDLVEMINQMNDRDAMAEFAAAAELVDNGKVTIDNQTDNRFFGGIKPLFKLFR